MRSPLLLLLLITTPCYDLSTPSVDAIDGETSGQVVRNQPPSKPTQDELNGLSKDGLKLKITEVKNDLENKKGEKTKIERELGKAKSDRESAYQNYTKADGERNRTLLDKTEKESALQSLSDEVHRKDKELANAQSARSEAADNIKLPPAFKDIEQYLLNLTARATNFSMVSEEISGLRQKIEELTSKENDARGVVIAKNTFLSNARKLFKEKLKCSVEKTDGVMEDSQCDEQRSVIGNAQEEYNSASKALLSVQSALREAQMEQSANLYMEALHNETLAETASSEANNLLLNVTGDVVNAVSIANNRVNKTRGTLTSSEEELKRKEQEFKKIEKEVENLEKMLNSYETEYAKRPETSTVNSTAPSPSFAMIGGLSGGIVFLLALGGIVAFLLIRKHRNKVKIEQKIIKVSKRNEIIQEEYGPEDARIFDKFGFPVMDARDFKYKTIVLTDVYDGDMPHEKANESTTNLPQQYIFRKDQLEFYFYGLPGDKPIVTGKKLYDIEKIKRKVFFGIMEGLDVDDDIPKIINNPTDDRTPQRFADLAINHVAKMVLVPTPLDTERVRKEFLEYLHAMASHTYKDHATAQEQNFPFEYYHVYWILVNAREVLKEHHTTSLHKFDGSVVIVGDLNGQFPDLLRMFAQRATPTTPGWLTRNYLFLGNYTRGGNYSLEVLLFLLLLKILYPKHIILQRGHQEIEDVDSILWRTLVGRLNPLQKGEMICLRVEVIFKMIYDVFALLPVATLINNNIYCVHGGIAESLLVEDNKKLEEHFSKVPLPLPRSTADIPSLAIESLWNEPEMEIEGFVEIKAAKDRSARQFGIKEYLAFKKKFGISLMFRGHQLASNGFAFPLDGTLVTTYSALNSDAHFNRGATFEIHLNGHISTTVCGRDSEVKTAEEAIQVFKENHPKNQGMRKYVEPEPKKQSMRGKKPKNETTQKDKLAAETQVDEKKKKSQPLLTRLFRAEDSTRRSSWLKKSIRVSEESAKTYDMRGKTPNKETTEQSDIIEETQEVTQKSNKNRRREKIYLPGIGNITPEKTEEEE